MLNIYGKTIGFARKIMVYEISAFSVTSYVVNTIGSVIYDELDSFGFSSG
jgi:hypothetical protein